MSLIYLFKIHCGEISGLISEIGGLPAHQLGYRSIRRSGLLISEHTCRESVTLHACTMDVSKEQKRPDDWHLVGHVSSFSDIGQDEKGCRVLSGCKTLSIPKTDDPEQSRGNRLSDLSDQVLVFKYKGFLHAIDNVCPNHNRPFFSRNVG
jgi:hypothetical protein